MRQQVSESVATENTPGSTSDEARLIKLAQRGEQYAISALYRNHVDAIYRYIRMRVSDDQVAEDLTAQVFVKVLEALPTYEITDRPFRAWLYRIAYARTVDYFRRQSRRQEVVLPDTLVSDEPPPDARLEAEASWARAVNLIAQLTDDQQDVLVLRFMGELSLSDVAETLGKSVGAVKSLQHRALSTISRLMEEEDRSVRSAASG